MTMGMPADAVSGLCHVVMKFPALGVAVCLAGASYAGNTIPISFPGLPPQSLVEEQSCGDRHPILIDIKEVSEYVSLGECLDDYVPIEESELRERCLVLPDGKTEDLCDQIL